MSLYRSSSSSSQRGCMFTKSSFQTIRSSSQTTTRQAWTAPQQVAPLNLLLLAASAATSPTTTTTTPTTATTTGTAKVKASPFGNERVRRLARRRSTLGRRGWGRRWRRTTGASTDTRKSAFLTTLTTAFWMRSTFLPAIGGRRRVAARPPPVLRPPPPRQRRRPRRNPLPRRRHGSRIGLPRLVKVLETGWGVYSTNTRQNTQISNPTL